MGSSDRIVPGLSGQLFRQSAVTISATMLISAVNALTLSPALCAIFLRYGGPRRGFMARIFCGIGKAQNGYAEVVRRLVRVSIVSLVSLVGSGAGIYALARITPTSFLPEEDWGRSSYRFSCRMVHRCSGRARP
jgi:multidrug efflux pump subunit AcrB